MTTGERMRERRKELGYSADYVAEQLGVSRSTVFRYENGDIEKLPVDVLTPLAKILHATPAYLMGWDDDISKISNAVPYVRGRRLPILGAIPAGVPVLAIVF